MTKWLIVTSVAALALATGCKSGGSTIASNAEWCKKQGGTWNSASNSCQFQSPGGEGGGGTGGGGTGGGGTGGGGTGGGGTGTGGSGEQQKPPVAPPKK